MTDSMKFGPEWLRNLSGDNSNSGVGSGGTANLITPRYQLAEHRYGREEMLALFDRNCKPPEGLISSPTLYIEKTQLPLAFIPETEDETRARNSGVSNSGPRGRGGSVDRGGRIRPGRGGMFSSHYSRGVGFDDSGEGSRLDSQPYSGRNRPFDRSQSERGWSERNGISDPSDWNGSTSPRKELGRGTSGSSLMEGNWRRHRGAGDEEEGWRINSTNRGEKWNRGSWRESGPSDRDRLDRSDGDLDESRGPGRWETRGIHRTSHDSSHHHHPARTARTWESNHHENHDNLPEWATENPSESGGSFDASGAFHGGMFSDEDDEGAPNSGGAHEHRTRRVSEGTNSTHTRSGSKPIPYNNNNTINSGPNRQTNTSSNSLPRERPKSLHPFDEKESTVEQERSVSPTKQSTITPPANPSFKSSPSLSNPAIKKIPTAVNIPKVATEPSRVQAPQRSKSFVELPNKSTSIIHDSRAQQAPVVLPSTINAQILHENTPERLTRNLNSTQKPEDDLDRMKKEAVALVAKLMDEESLREEVVVPPVLPSANHVPPMVTGAPEEKWFYRDPQGEVQGPFLASEMAEWCKAGYFTLGLLVRRTCDERYSTLGDLMKLYGRSPFIQGPSIPPLKITEPVIALQSAVPAGLPGSALPKPGIKENPLFLLQIQQMRMLQNQQQNIRNQLATQMKNSAFAKLTQSEHWAALTPVEQNQLMQYTMHDCDVRDIPMASNPFVAAPLASPATNPVMQLYSQMPQGKGQNENHLPPNQHSGATVHPGGSLDPIQQFLQQIAGIQNMVTTPQANLNPQTNLNPPSQEDDVLKTFIRQLHVNANGHPQSHQVDSIWPQPPPQINPQFNAQNWLAQVGPLPPMPPGQVPNSLWDLHSKEMKTEQQILEEQNLRLQDDRKKEELKRQEEESAKRKLEEEAARKLEVAKRQEDDRKRKEEEKRLKDEEKRKHEDELKKREEKKQKDEERKREEKRKQDEENNKKKQEEEKKKRDEAKKLEEKQKKEDEKRKKLEEEQKRLEEERLKKEEEARKKLEAEEHARRTEQRRREAEALKKLQERSKAPWAQAPHAPPPTTHASLAEIQRLEREKKAEEQRCQQLIQQQLAQQKAEEAAKETAAADSSKRLQFKWAEKAAPNVTQPQVKSLAQIQQEEQERIAKVKQQERERLEKANQKEMAVAMQNAGIWGAASQSLSWATTANSGNDSSKLGNKAWTASGFWDEPALNKSATVVAKPPVKVVTPMPNKQTVQQTTQQSQSQNNNKTTKTKLKKDEEFVKKIFENNTAKSDDFTQWCNRTLCGLQVSVDIPTFVGFLRDIESAYEVKEYVRMYLGDTKQCTEFAKQFLEKRSKWRSAQRPQAEADDLCKPAPAINPNAPTEFQEVKGKAKKPKKGKMFKVDNRILGFSVTAATDRINVGDRDYGEGV